MSWYFRWENQSQKWKLTNTAKEYENEWAFRLLIPISMVHAWSYTVLRSFYFHQRCNLKYALNVISSTSGRYLSCFLQRKVSISLRGVCRKLLKKLIKLGQRDICLGKGLGVTCHSLTSFKVLKSSSSAFFLVPPPLYPPQARFCLSHFVYFF